MKTTILLALLAMIGLTACEKTVTNNPAPATVEKHVTTPVPVPVPTPVPGPQGPEGPKGEPGKPGGDTTIVVPPAENPPPNR
ncbi:hypothetical protein ACHMW6_10260 [Pseudoduganella sp. UC29_106]|uniref:hypothetical protein n=1 Tax=Pseudoduganella sp. UC29_106 TaxID=3374553 RepID=UPI003757439E